MLWGEAKAHPGSGSGGRTARRQHVDTGGGAMCMGGRRVSSPGGLGRVASEGAASWGARRRVWGLMGAQTAVDGVHGTSMAYGAAADPEQRRER